MAPPGLSALGAKGSACDRLRLTGGLRAPALGRYEVPFHWGGTAPSGAISYAAFGGENHTTALRARESPPLVAGATTFPPQAGGTTNRAKLRVTYEKIASRSFVLPPLAGKSRTRARGNAFPTPTGRLYGFRRQRRHKKWRLWRRASPAQRYYITPEGESPQPVREASAGPGQNPWRPGPKARRRHQPSRRSRVNLREYWKAPTRSRSRPRQRRLSPHVTSSACDV